MNSLAVHAMPITDSIAEMLRRFSVKAIVRKIDVSPRTVENWREGRTAPQARHMVAMLRDDELCALLLEKVNPDAAHQVKVAAARKKLKDLEGE